MADAKIIQLGSGGPAGRGSRGSPSASARRLAPPQAGRRSRSRADGSAAGAQARSRTAPESRDSETHAPPPKSDATPGPEETPRRSVSSALLSELFGLRSRSLESLKSLPIAQLRALAADPVHTLASLAQALGVDWDSSVEETLAFLRQRLEGDYAVDEFGFDPEFTTKIYLPLLRQIADHWFRVEVRGAENLPMDGSALLVSNHAGTLPLDGMILHTVVYDEIGRHVRMLGADLIFKTPYSGDLARKTGTTLACQEDAERLLASNQLVAVFPEGFKGLGKPYADRYKLQRFGRGGFVTAAIRAQVPIIPIAIVGSEEIYPLIAKAPALARALGVPYFPITPLFPWFGPLGMIPLPSKWIIQFGEAITTDELGPGAADDPMTVFNITDQVRETIQQTLYALLMQRRSAFF
jgi:1-acyl-sn-glycerol-3-phosphate acyltransferase